MKTQLQYNIEALESILTRLSPDQIRHLYDDLKLGDLPALPTNHIPELVKRTTKKGQLAVLVRQTKQLVRDVNWSTVELRTKKDKSGLSTEAIIGLIVTSIIALAVAVFANPLGRAGIALFPEPTVTLILPTTTSSSTITPQPQPSSTAEPLNTPAPLVTYISPTETPLPFKPAKADEALIVIAKFEGDIGGDAQHSIWTDLLQLKDKPKGVRVERDNILVTDAEAAKALGKKWNATLVIWGFVGSKYLQPFVQRVKADLTDYEPESNKLSLSEPATVTFELLPQQVRFLSLFGLGLTDFENANFTNTIRLLDQAIVMANNLGVRSVAESYFFRAYAYAYKPEPEYEIAISDYTRAIELKPEFPEAFNNRGLAYAYKSKPDYGKAYSDFDKAIELKADYALAFNNRGSVHLVRLKALHEQPRDAQTAINLEEALIYFNRAIADFTRAIELRPDYASAYNNRGLAYKNKPPVPDYDLAIKDFGRAIDVASNFSMAYFNRGSTYALIGELHNKETENDQAIVAYKLAINDFTKVIDLVKDDAQAFLQRGLVYYFKSDYDQAVKDFSKAIDLNPNGAGAYLGRASALHLRKSNPNYEQVIKDCTMFIALKPESVDSATYYIRGFAYFSLSKPDYDRAIADFTRAIEIDSNNADAYYGRGLAYATRSNADNDKVIDDYTKAIALKPDYDLAYANRGSILAAQGKTQEAKRDIENCIAITKDSGLKSFCEERLTKLQ